MASSAWLFKPPASLLRNSGCNGNSHAANAGDWRSCHLNNSMKKVTWAWRGRIANCNNESGFWLVTLTNAWLWLRLEVYLDICAINLNLINGKHTLTFYMILLCLISYYYKAVWASGQRNICTTGGDNGKNLHTDWGWKLIARMSVMINLLSLFWASLLLGGYGQLSIMALSL